MRNIARIALALTPLFSVPVASSLLAGGRLNFGGGEKDVILIVPWLLWSFLYASSSFFFWARGRSFARATGLSIAAATAGTLLSGLVLALMGQLGIGGRY